MKRFIALLCAAVLCLTLTGCGGAPAATSMVPPSPRDTAAPADSTTPAPSPVPTGGTSGVPSPTPSGATYDEAVLTRLAAALAVYPTGAVEPKEDDYLLPEGGMDFEAFDRDYTAWLNAESARPAVPESAGNLHSFFREAETLYLTGGTENRACSPLNIYFALCLIAEISGGESRAQVLRLLGADTIENLRAQAHQIWNALYKDNGDSTLLFGTSLWMREDIRFKQDTLNRMAESYYASSFSGDTRKADFTAALRAWLNRETHGLLEEQAGNITLDPETVLALASTLYFKAPWLDQFEESLTRSEVFHTPAGDRNAPFLHEIFNRRTFYAGDSFTAFPVPLETGEMWLVLPKEGTTPDDLLRAGVMENLLSDSERFVSARNANVSLSLPKFDVTGELDLIDGLKTLGVTHVFDHTKSDFIPLTEDVKNLEITQIQHAARVKIDEEGCEAAAFTVTKVNLTSAMMDEPEHITFTLDRPFLFAVAGEGSLPLFTGVVNTPEAA